MYIKSHPPVYYLKASHGDHTTLPSTPYKDRAHKDSASEAQLGAKYDTHGTKSLERVGSAFRRDLKAELGKSIVPLPFTPLMIIGLDCLEQNTECLGKN